VQDAELYRAALFSRTEGFAELRAGLHGNDDLAYLFDDPARDDHLIVPFPGDANHDPCKAKFWNDHRAICLDDFLALTAITSEHGDDDKDIHEDYLDQVFFYGDWSEAP
jgi:hypothetical protein